MASQLDNRVIRDSSPPELARYLQTQLRTANWRTISDHLVSSVGSGSIPPDVFHVWLGVSKEPAAIVALLRQDVSALGRQVAIRRFGKSLRTDAAFSAIWHAFGDVQGLVQLMQQLSVHHLRLLCEAISLPCSAPGARTQRQQAVTELYDTLCGNGKIPNPDTRPLRPYYDKLIPACTTEIVLRYTADHTPGLKLVEAHKAALEEQALTKIFTGPGKLQSIKGFQTLLDESRQFAMTVLERLAADQQALEFNAEWLLHDLVNPLLKRFGRARDHEASDRVLRLALQCAQQEPQVVQRISLQPKGLIYHAAQHWKRSRNRSKAEELLGDLLSTISRKDVINLTDIVSLMRTVEEKSKFSLLRLIVLHLRRFGIDLSLESQETDQKIAEAKISWPAAVFLELPAPDALRLFRRLLKAQPDANFISPRTNRGQGRIITSKEVNSTGGADPEIMAAFLESRMAYCPDENSLWLERARNLVAERKKKAVSVPKTGSQNSEEIEERAAWAVSAMQLSIATGSIDIYADTLLWARRYNRDTQTVKRLYSQGNVLTEEGLDLLSAIPSSRTKRQLPSLDKIKTSIIKSNNAMFKLIETATMSIQEPSFDLSDWESVRSLPAKVIRRRVDRTKALQKTHGLSDNDIMDSIWRPTINFLTTTERFCMQPEHSRLVLDDIRGLLKDLVVEQPSLSTCKFLDGLAQKRDQMWVKFRPTIHPAATTLQSFWPRGLPVQALCPEMSEFKSALASMPYTVTRCEHVVFSDSTVLNAAPEDEETREAIGPFVDNYKYALGIYLLHAEHQQDQRLSKAWYHAITTLNGSRMNGETNIGFWKNIFGKLVLIPGLEENLERLGLVPKPQIVAPELPAPQDDDVPVEWDPYPMSKTSHLRSKSLPQTCLDSMLESKIDSWHCPVDTPFATAFSVMVEKSQPRLWDSDKTLKQLPAPSREAMVAASAAYINAKYGSTSSLSLKAFPTEEDSRYPAFYLYEEFLEAYKKQVVAGPLKALSALSTRVPVPLLSSLSRSLMARLNKNEKEDPAVREAAMATIKALARSDRPEVARQLVQQVVLHRNDDSSWHRHLFNAGFLRQLSAQEARTFFSDICAEIQQRQEKISAERVRRKEEKRSAVESEQDPDLLKPEQGGKVSGSPAPSMTKVTTIKMIAQVLRDADFIDRGFTCNMLINLFNSSPHQDVRTAVVDGLISTLMNTQDRELSEVIFKILEEHIVPIASSINERRPPTEAEWLAAESGDGPLPEVLVMQPGNPFPPILELLVNTTIAWEKETAEHQEWVTRILAPIVEKSTAENARWNALFVKHHQLDIPDACFPAIPVRPKLLVELWSRTPLALTRRNFDSVTKYALANLRLHDSLTNAIEILTKDRDFTKSNAGEYWLSLWNNRGSLAFGCGIFEIAKALFELEHLNEAELQAGDIQRFLRCLVTDFIANSEVAHYQSFVNCLNGNCDTSRERWLANCLPLLEDIIKEVDGLRTKEWTRNPKRTPARLPLTFLAKKEILRMKHEHLSKEALSQEAIDDFVADFSALIEVAEPLDSPYHTKLPSLQIPPYDIFDVLHFVPIALAIASSADVQAPTQKDYVKINIAEKLIQYQHGGVTSEMLARMKKMSQAWAESPCERIWFAGQELSKRVAGWERMLKKNDGQSI